MWDVNVAASSMARSRVEAMGVTMTNGANFMVDGKIVPVTSTSRKKKRIEAFAKTIYSCILKRIRNKNAQ